MFLYKTPPRYLNDKNLDRCFKKDVIKKYVEMV